MRVVLTNLAKTLVCKREHDVILSRYTQRISSDNDHHTPLLKTRIRQRSIQSSSCPGHLCTPLVRRATCGSAAVVRPPLIFTNLTLTDVITSSALICTWEEDRQTDR